MFTDIPLELLISMISCSFSSNAFIIWLPRTSSFW